MYHDFFGLREAPFRITPNTGFFFAGGNRGAILDALLYAIGQGEGIVKVTGEVGSGKTMLCRMLQSRLPDDVLGIYLANPGVAPDEILQAIAHELELQLPPAPGRLETLQQITACLLACHSANRQVVLFVEESQAMPIATLEEIRLLSNLETDRHKLLQIVLFGQPELDLLLRKPEIRQLRERITHSFSLAPLSAEDIGLYLNFRLRAAGYKGPDVFGPAVVRQIARASAGLTRRVNLLGDKTLLAAFSEDTHAVQPRHVRAAIGDSEFAQNGFAPFTRLNWPWLIGGFALAVALALLVGAGIWIGSRTQAAPGLPMVQMPTSPGPRLPARADAPTPQASAAVPASTGGPEAPLATSLPPEVMPPSAELPAAASAPAAARAESLSPPTTAASFAVGMLTSPPASPAPPAPAPAASLLERRLAATQAWLRESPPTVVTIQLMGTPSEAQLERQLRSLGAQIDTAQLFVYRTRAGTRPLMTVVYGTYASRAEAQTALSALPPSIRSFAPHLRTVQGIRAEIDAAGS